ncbi:MAG TPA: hypothetical protein VEM13_05085 [Gemmatimonadales bacterium]|nr:hypothetical protein [Gemmatimonadales bacterium]
MRALWAVVTVAAVAPLPSQRPGLPQADRVRLAEAFRLADEIQDRVWPHLSRAPFALLLVTDGFEFLVRHPKPSDDFQALGYDSLLESDVFVRRRAFAPNLLATFPAVGGVPTIVIGEPARTDKSSTEWVLTVLHEHFHQLQYSRPGYYAGVDSLHLSRGDRTGMWMLTYPFPFDSVAVAARVAELARALDAAVAALFGGDRAPTAALAAYAAARRRLQEVVSADDYRYLCFQLWQEGVARYVEYRGAVVAAERYSPTAAFRALPDVVDFAATAERLRRDLRGALSGVNLAKQRREIFYPMGAATALLLDAIAPRWQERYFAGRFTLDPLFDAPP